MSNGISDIEKKIFFKSKFSVLNENVKIFYVHLQFLLLFDYIMFLYPLIL